MKKTLLFVLLTVLAISSSAYAQGSSVRLGTSSVSYDKTAFDHARASVALGTEGRWYYVGTRADFDRDSVYWNVAQLEVGPRFLRAGPGVVLGDPNDTKSNQWRVNLSATFKPWKGLYVNSRWAPVSLNNRPNSKNWLDASAGWQFNF